MIFKTAGRCTKCNTTDKYVWYWFYNEHREICYRMYCTKCNHSSVLHGGTSSSSDDDKWRPAFDHIINKKKFLEIKPFIFRSIRSDYNPSPEENDQINLYQKLLKQ